MITAQRQRRRGRATAVVAVLATAIGLLVGLASPAGAASLTFEGIEPDTQGTLIGTAGGRTQRLTAGRFIVTVDGQRATGYCIDIHNRADRGPLDEIDWETSGVANLEAIKAILVNYTADGDEPADFPLVGSKADRALAIQAAIWHYSDGFELTGANGGGNVTPDNVTANYATILEAVDGGHISGGGEPTVSLSITPPDDTEGNVGDLVGPFVVNTTAASVTVTTTEGITLRDAEGEPFTGDVTDGTELWVSADEAIEGTISATAQAEVRVGRVFYGQQNGRDLQRIVLASPVTVDAAAEAQVSFVGGPPPTEPPPSTTSTTSTTVPIEHNTTVVDNPTTTTVPIETNQDEGDDDSGGGLPVTGAQTIVLVVVALALLGVGTAFGIIGRRKRLSDG